jgi:glycosyltransferase involved in cell wall biosynthesis
VKRCAFISFRLGLSDGVSIVAELWQRCFQDLGWTTLTVAGEGPVDRLVPRLALAAGSPPPAGGDGDSERSGAVAEALVEEVAAALADADLVVAENILSIPLHLEASRAVTRALQGRPAILHHHDPPWQRPRFAHVVELPPHDPAWRHVTINHLTAAQFAQRGLTATTIPNGFDTEIERGERSRTRRALGLSDSALLTVHPVRAIERKNIPAALAISAALGATYWLPGPAEEDYAPTLEALLSHPPCPVIRTPPGRLDPPATIADLYAAADLVLFPSTWEGFGNPPIEAALHHKPVVVGPYPVAHELRDLGFWWLDPDDTAAIAAAGVDPPAHLLARNRQLVERHLSLAATTRRVKRLLDEAGWSGDRR